MTFLISVVAQSTTIFLRCGVHCNTPSSTRLSTRYFASGREQSLLSVISLRRFVIYQLLSQITGFSASSGMAPFYRKRLGQTHAFPYYVFLEVIRILCSHHAFVQSPGSYAFIVGFVRSPRRRSSPRQGVLGPSLSRCSEGLEVGSR